MQDNEQLSINKLKTALATLEWPKVKAVLDEAGGHADNAKSIAEAIRRTGDLVIRYPNASVAQRDALLENLANYLICGMPNAIVPKQVSDAVDTVRVAEAGYRKLVHALSRTDASKLSATVHVAAAIRRAEEEVLRISVAFKNQTSKRDHITLQTHITDEFGNVVDMDSAVESFVRFVSLTLKMEAYKNRWIDADEMVVVPTLPEVTDEQVFQAGATLILAVIWQRWEVTEEQARVQGRTLRFLRDDERPKNAPAEFTHYIVEEGDDTSDWLHRIAFERVADKLAQNLMEVRAQKYVYTEPRPGLGGVRPLPPHHWISDEEAHGVWALEQYLGYGVVGDQERPAGLRLVEWVRGYCALIILARETGRSGLVRTKAGWQDFFASFGLAAEASAILINILTFRKSSRDLFDHPFIKIGDGRYRLFDTALRSMSIPIVVLSTLSHLSVQLKRKGPAFESVVRRTFENAGIKAYHFKATRDKEEYEYDAVVPWGEFLFVIECKNRSLPFGSSVQMRYFDLESRTNIKQVKRLLVGLEKHPDILEKHLPPGPAKRTIVPIIVNCFPFSGVGKIDGVYFYDYSALARFFASGEIKLKSIPATGGVTEQGSGIRLWAGDEPTPEDLISQLNFPQQIDNIIRSLKRDLRGFPLPPDWWVHSVSFSREDSAFLHDVDVSRSTNPAFDLNNALGELPG